MAGSSRQLTPEQQVELDRDVLAECVQQSVPVCVQYKPALGHQLANRVDAALDRYQRGAEAKAKAKRDAAAAAEAQAEAKAAAVAKVDKDFGLAPETQDTDTKK